MAISDRSTLKNNFGKGQIPMAEDFEHLIDSPIYQEEDGIKKNATTALEIQGAIPLTEGKQDCILLYKSFQTYPIPNWKISLIDSTSREEDFDGLSIGENANDYLFIQEGTGNIGIGTNNPKSKLNIDGSLLLSGTTDPIPLGLTKNINGSTSSLSLDANLDQLETDDSVRGAAFKINVSDTDVVFQWVKRNAGQDSSPEEILLQLDESGVLTLGARNIEESIANLEARIAVTEVFETRIAAIESLETRITATEVFETRIAAIESLETRIAAIESFETRIVATESLETRIAAIEAFGTRITATEAFATRIAATEAFGARIAATEAFGARIAATEAFETRITATEAFETRITATEAFETRITATEAFGTRITALENSASGDE